MSNKLIFRYFLIILMMTQVYSLNCSIYRNNEEIFETLRHLFLINPFEKSIRQRSWIKQNLFTGALEVHAEGIRNIPSTFFCLRKVKTVFISSSSFEHPNDFSENIHLFAPNLTSLSVYHTKIGQLNEKFGKLIYLRRLHLVGAGLRWIPPSIRDVRRLTDVDFSDNDLTDLPDDLRLLDKLQSFIVSNNPRLTSLKSLDHHPSLQHLKADGCSIQQMPKNLSNVYLLYLADNQISNLDGIETIGSKISQPKEFSFINNRIGFISLNILQVRNLSRFVVDGNQLANIPKQLLDVKTFQCISFKNNPIDSIEFNRTIDEFREKFGSTIFCTNPA